MEAQCLVEGQDQLGEGPCWSAREGRLYWFDIKQAQLRWYEPATRATQTFALPFRASAAAVRLDGTLLLATDQGLAAFTSSTGEAHLVKPMGFEPGFRSNEGKIGLDGSFWWSTMDDDHAKRPGAIYRTKPDLGTELMLEGIYIPNTLSMSPDGEVLYLADTRLRTMFAYATADLAERREFIDTRGEAGAPDGSAVDADGYLWNAQWGGGRVVRYAPDGRIDRIIPLPVSQPTSCAFGGADLGTLFITSAWDGLSDEARAEQPLAGALFSVDPGVRGLPLPMFEG